MLLHDKEIEELSEFFHGWRVEVIRLEPQRGQARVSWGSSLSHRILHLHAGSALAVRGTVHKSCSCVLQSASQRVAVCFLGKALRAGDLVLAGAGANMDLFVPSGAGLFVGIAGSQDSLARRELRICDGTSESASALSQFMLRPDEHGGDVRALLTAYFRNAVAASTTLEADRVASTARISAVVSACRLLEKRLPAPISLSDLSRHCGVAERTLEYGFRQMYGTTPLTYVRSQRLARSRIALLHAKRPTSISETARAFGFTHMGQFSRDYRRLFGETPSTTLARGQSERERQPSPERSSIHQP